MLIGRQANTTAAISTDDVARLRGALLRLARDLRRLATDEGLTPSRAGVLGVLVARGPLRAGDLASAEGINPTMASRVLADLEAAGLVAREADPVDRRATLVHVTAAGAKRAKQLKARRTAVLAERLDALSPGQADALLAALPALEALAGLETAAADDPADADAAGEDRP